MRFLSAVRRTPSARDLADCGLVLAVLIAAAATLATAVPGDVTRLWGHTVSALQVALGGAG